MSYLNSFWTDSNLVWLNLLANQSLLFIAKMCVVTTANVVQMLSHKISFCMFNAREQSK